MPRRDQVMSEFVAQVGARIRDLRFERGLSMRKLAELAECSAESIVQVELGRSAITTKTLRKLAKALRVEPLDILNHDAQTNDLGWMVETMRRDPECVRIVGAGVKRAQAQSPRRSSSSTAASC